MPTTTCLNGRYLLWKCLSDGPGGAVYLAEDRRSPTQPVTLKSLALEEPDSGAQISDDLTRLPGIRHPHLNPLLDFGRVQDVLAADATRPRSEAWKTAGDLGPTVSTSQAPPVAAGFITTPYLSGPDLRGALAALLARSPSPEELDSWLTAVGIQILGALQYLHDRTLLHFDIKPEHILFTEVDSPEPHAFLIDLGLTARATTPLGNRVRGTAPYIAPEVLDRSMVDHRVDLYSFGASLYHSLTDGVLLPSPETKPLEPLGHYPPPRDLVPNLSPFWNRVILKLLERDPERRFPTAAVLIDELERHSPDAARQDGMTLHRPSRLVGQEKEFDYIARDLEKLQVGESGSTLLLLGGPDGVGKHAVSDSLSVRARWQGIETFRTRCRGISDTPLGPLARLLEEVRGHRRTPPALRSELETIIQWIRSSPPPADGAWSPLADREDDRFRFRARVGEALAQLRTSESYLFIIEDLHRAAPELVELIAVCAHRIHLERGPFTPEEGEAWLGDDAPSGIGDTGAEDSTPPRVLFVVTADDRQPGETLEAPGRVFTLEELCAVPHVSRVELKPLSLVRTKDLVREILGPSHLPDLVYRELHEVTGGYPQTLVRTLRECQYHGLLRREQHGWAWRGDGSVRDQVLSGRAREWATLGDRSVLLLELLEREGSMEDSELEETLTELSVENPRRLIDRLESWGWIRCRITLEGERIVSPDRPLPAHSLLPQRSQALAQARARVLLKRPDRTVAAVEQLLDEAADAELGALLPRTIETLREHHLDATLVQLLQRLRKRGDATRSPTARLEEARALLELKHLTLAQPLLEELLHSQPPRDIEAVASTLMGQILRQQGKHAQSGQHLERAVEIAKAAELLPTRILATLEMGQLQLDSGFPDKARRWALRAEDLAVNAGDMSDPRLASQTKSFHARVLAAENLPDRAVKLLRSFIDDQRDLLPPAWLTRLLNQMAEVQFTQARYEEAKELWSESLALESRHQNLRSVAQILGNIGMVHLNWGDQEKASTYHRHSLKIREEILDAFGIAASQNNIGLIYKMQSLYDDAEACFRRCLKIYEQLGDPGNQAIALNNLSNIMISKGEYALALQYSLRGLEKRKVLNNQARIAYSYYNIAYIYRTQGELQRAADYAEKSLEIRRELGDKLSLALTLTLLGDIHLARGRYDDGFRCLRQSLANFEALGDRVGRHTALTLHGLLYQQVGLYDEALEYSDRSLKIAREQHLEYYTGASFLNRGLIHLARSDLARAETDLNQAEDVFRAASSRKEIANVLLKKTELAGELGNQERALGFLAEAYSYIEQLGLLDLYPLYYRLRGGIAAQNGADSAAARQLLERGLEEAQRREIPEEAWRIQHLLGRLELERGDTEAARHWLGEAVEGVEQLHSRLPSQFQESYLQTTEQIDLRADWESLGTSKGVANAPESPPKAPLLKVSAEGAAGDDLWRLHEITLLLNSERNLQALLERILDTVLDLFHAERGFFILVKSAEHEIRVARNLDREDVEGPEYKYSHSIAREVAETGQTFITNDAQHDSRLKDAESVHDMRLQAIACFPLVWQEETLGVIYIENRFRKRIVDPERVPILRAFSNQAAGAIMSTRLAEEAEQKREELERSRVRIHELNRRLEIRVEEQSRELESARLELELKQSQLEHRFRFHNILGQCEEMQALYRVLERISGTELPVLIEGESGTGKELVAHAIHYHSQRRRETFVSENCGALAESLLESELFGHVKGAFTGADSDRPGLFALAEGGTLFLDEVHGLTLGMQRKLLRVLQEGEYRQVGGEEVKHSNVRIISASNRPLLQLARDGQFREDLYYRLNVLRIDLPPLRDRGQDVILLARHFLAQVVERESLEPLEFSPAAMRQLATHAYPGNVRELRNIIEKSAILCRTSKIEPADILFDSLDPSRQGPGDSFTFMDDLPFREAKDEFQRRYVSRLLKRHQGVVTRAARDSGITRESLHRLIRRFDIPR